jgi:hypothetical protein
MALKLGPILTVALFTFLPAATVWAEAVTNPVEEQFDNPIPPPKSDLPQSYIDNWGGLRPDHGREETFFACVVCHTEGRILRSRMTRDEWKATLERLSEFHDVPPLEPDEQGLILDYLDKNYGPHIPRD